MKYFKLTKSMVSPEIKAVEIESQTLGTVTIQGRKYKKVCGYECYLPTFEQAHAVLIAYLKEKVDTAKLAYDYALECLENAEKID